MVYSLPLMSIGLSKSLERLSNSTKRDILLA